MTCWGKRNLVQELEFLHESSQVTWVSLGFWLTHFHWPLCGLKEVTEHSSNWSDHVREEQAGPQPTSHCQLPACSSLQLLNMVTSVGRMQSLSTLGNKGTWDWELTSQALQDEKFLWSSRDNESARVCGMVRSHRKGSRSSFGTYVATCGKGVVEKEWEKDEKPLSLICDRLAISFIEPNAPRHKLSHPRE